MVSADTNAILSCRTSSLSAEEPMAGTAVESTDFWVLIECHETWAPKILKGRTLSTELKAHLAGVESDLPGTRIQLIKPPHPSVQGGMRLVCVDCRHGQVPRVFSGEMSDLNQLLTLDFGAIRDGQAPSWMAPYTEPFVLVCTHGKRDVCCGVHGTAFIQHIPTEYREYVWQTSHLGGHRFAPTAVVFPHGYCYGRLAPEQAPAFMAAALSDELFDLNQLRGCVALPRPAQCAEITYRMATSNRRIEALTISTESAGENVWDVTITPASHGDAPTLRVQRHAGGPPVIPSCGKRPEPSRPFKCTWNPDS